MHSLLAARRPTWAFATLLLVIALACAGRRAPAPSIDLDAPGTFLDSLAAQSDASEVVAAKLFLTFSGGFLEEEKLTLNGQLVIAWPDRVRLIGAYGTFKKVFDLLVVGDRFEVYDHAEHVLFRGHAYDAAAAERLGLAARPGDLARLLRFGGAGPLTGARATSLRSTGDGVQVRFAFPEDDGAWTAVYDDALRLTHLSRRTRGPVTLEVSYHDYFRADGRNVPRRVVAVRPLRGERAEVDVRSITFPEDAPSRAFRTEHPEDIEVIELSSRQ